MATVSLSDAVKWKAFKVNPDWNFIDRLTVVTDDNEKYEIEEALYSESPFEVAIKELPEDLDESELQNSILVSTIGGVLDSYRVWDVENRGGAHICSV